MAGALPFGQLAAFLISGDKVPVKNPFFESFQEAVEFVIGIDLILQTELSVICKDETRFLVR